MGRFKDWFLDTMPPRRKRQRRRSEDSMGVSEVTPTEKQGVLAPILDQSQSEKKETGVLENGIGAQLSFHDKMIRNDIIGCRQLLKSGLDPNRPFCTTRNKGVRGGTTGMTMRRIETTYVHLAIIYRRPTILQVLLEAGASTCVMDSAERTPLQVAVTYWPRARYSDPFTMTSPLEDENIKYRNYLTNQHMKSEHMFKLLVQYGAQVCIKMGERGEGLLHLAAKYNTLGCVEALLAHGADVNATDSKGQTPLIAALSGAHIKFALSLLKEQTDVNICNQYGRTALHHACQVDMSERSDVVKQILTRGSLLDVKDCDGNTPLHFAAMVGNATTVTTLIKYNADADIMNNLGESPLDLLLRHPHVNGCLEDALRHLYKWTLYTRPNNMDFYRKICAKHEEVTVDEKRNSSPPSLLAIALLKTRRCLGYDQVLKIMDTHLEWPHGLKKMVCLSDNLDNLGF